MPELGWYAQKGKKISHIVAVTDGVLVSKAWCGVKQSPKGEWIPEGLHRRCKRCRVIEGKIKLNMSITGTVGSWLGQEGMKAQHFVPTDPSKKNGYGRKALCGIEPIKRNWLPLKGLSDCKSCKIHYEKGRYTTRENIIKHNEAILKKKEKPEMQKEGWYSRKGMTVAHFVETCAQTDGGSEELLTSAMCGAHETSKESWKSIIEREPLPRCKRCLSAILKKRVTGAIEDFVEPTDMSKNPKAFDMQVQYNQVVGETIPLTWIPVLDVKVVIDLLKRGMDSESCKVSRGVTSAVIKELQVYINEAEERCSRPDGVTTWAHEGEEK
jgi:hypothetical protein